MSSLSAKQAADLIGVSIKTLHRWEAAGKIHPTRTAGGHRRYQVADLLGHQGESALTLGYARVSHPSQKVVLERQVQVLQSYCTQQGWNFEILKDMGSGIDTRKRDELIRDGLQILNAGRSHVGRPTFQHVGQLVECSQVFFSTFSQDGQHMRVWIRLPIVAFSFASLLATCPADTDDRCW